MTLSCFVLLPQGPDYEKFAKYKKTDKFAEMLGLRPEPKKNMLGTLYAVCYVALRVVCCGAVSVVLCSAHSLCSICAYGTQLCDNLLRLKTGSRCTATTYRSHLSIFTFS
jgi:hypothetical protein